MGALYDLWKESITFWGNSMWNSWWSLWFHLSVTPSPSWSTKEKGRGIRVSILEGGKAHTWTLQLQSHLIFSLYEETDLFEVCLFEERPIFIFQIISLCAQEYVNKQHQSSQGKIQGETDHQWLPGIQRDWYQRWAPCLTEVFQIKS